MRNQLQTTNRQTFGKAKQFGRKRNSLVGLYLLMRKINESIELDYVRHHDRYENKFKIVEPA